MVDATQNWKLSTQVSYASTLLSAEWIQEAPSSAAGVLPLADYVTATFAPTANGSPPSFPSASNIAAETDAILMVDPYGETSAPSLPFLDRFSTCWGNNASIIASCAAP